MAARLLSIEAAVTHNEEAIIATAADVLARALTEAQRATWRCDHRFHGGAATLPHSSGEGVIRVTSLLEWLTPVESSWAAVEQAIRTTFISLCAHGHPVLVLTILRHVEAGADRARAQMLRVRIRRLNLLATEISREYGVFVVDLDRVLADLGARRLQTDYQLGGSRVREVAGSAVASCVIANLLDELTTAECQLRARDIIAKELPMFELPPGATSSHFWTVGQGVRRQTAAMTESAQANEIGWVVQQVIRRQISPLEALKKFCRKVGQRGVRSSASRVGGALRRLARSRP